MNSVHTIHGGIHPREEKQLSRPGQVIDAGLPHELILPLSQHIGAPAEPIVSVGDHVKGGQRLAEDQGAVSAAVHAPTSGHITAIDMQPVPHPSGLTNVCIRLTPDHADEWLVLQGLADYRSEAPDTVIAHIRAAGISGLGGAGFPTATKLLARERSAIHTLIINGTECEPYITADDTLMQVAAEQIVAGAEILAHILGAETILYGVEDNKPAALKAMREALAASDDALGQQQVVSFPTKYPSGGEKQLIEILTGEQVPSGGLPADLGIVCQNPGTAVAVRDAVIDGKPLTDRLVTVTGRAVSHASNYRVRLGTPIAHLLALAGFTPGSRQRLIHGGPMMGFALETDAVPVVKTTNCVLAPTQEELPAPPPAQACIRCGLCAEACPASLLPQQLYWYARAKDQEQLEKHHLFDCIECGACSWVCPSSIPLVQYYRAAKSHIVETREDKQRAERSKGRFEARQERVEREAAERERKRAERKATAQQKAAASDADDPVQAAIARAKARKEQAAQTKDAS